MQKKMKDISKNLNQIIKQYELQQYALRCNPECDQSNKDYVQKAKESDAQHDAAFRQQAGQNIAFLAMTTQNNMQENRNGKKVIKNLAAVVDGYDSQQGKMKKEQKKHSKKIAKLYKKIEEQQSELEKCQKQMKQQMEAIRCIAVYLGFGGVSDDLRKIQKKCEKQIEKRDYHCYRHNMPDVIDGSYREVKRHE